MRENGAASRAETNPVFLRLNDECANEKKGGGAAVSTGARSAAIDSPSGSIMRDDTDSVGGKGGEENTWASDRCGCSACVAATTAAAATRNDASGSSKPFAKVFSSAGDTGGDATIADTAIITAVSTCAVAKLVSSDGDKCGTAISVAVSTSAVAILFNSDSRGADVETCGGEASVVDSADEAASNEDITGDSGVADSLSNNAAAICGANTASATADSSADATASANTDTTASASDASVGANSHTSAGCTLSGTCDQWFERLNVVLAFDVRVDFLGGITKTAHDALVAQKNSTHIVIYIYLFQVQF